MCGVRNRLWTPGPDQRNKVCPHTAAITHLRQDKLAAIMRVRALYDHKLPGSHTRSLIFSDSQKIIEPASYGQPENLVGKVWFFYCCLNERIRCLCGRHREQARSHRGMVYTCE
jgi:regulator of extracellular matrix RemA (YlzA/DUF370 family)